MATRYLEKYGAAVLSNGYEIIPIKPGTKRPPGDDWQKIRANKKTLDGWLANGRAKFGLGVLARLSPLVDIDCRDPEIVRQMIRFTTKLIGPTVQRIGFAPKTGLLYRSAKPFPKVNSKIFVHPDDDATDKTKWHKLEVLGDGQQFVALAIHPDTHEPYRWVNKKGVHDTPRDDLPEITREDAEALAEHFEKLMLDAGYVVKTGSALKRMDARGIDEDDEFAVDNHPIDITTAELSLKLGLVPGAEDYDTWLQVGMALWHQYSGSDEGLILWHEWSAQASNYDQDVLDDKWPTFEIEGKGRQPVTARLILKLGNAEEKRLASEQVKDTKAEIDDAPTVEALKEVCDKIKRLAFDSLVRESVTNAVRKRYKDITGDAMAIATARQLTRYENPENKRTPKWLKDFVYIERDEVFYNLDNRMELTQKAFDARHNRYMMTQKDRLEGRSYPEHSASHAALNLWEIETVYRRMYMPHEDTFFTYNGQRFVNFYSEIGVPDVPDKLNAEEKMAIKRVQAHLRHLFAYEKDWKLLLDWLAYIVQTKKRINWMPLIQGAEGDGKTFFAHLLKVVLGWENVHIVAGEALEEKYNHFMEGALLVFFEEVRLHGNDRYAALNRIKPWITNQVISIRAMQRGSFEIVNTASILAASNHKDAIPAGDNDTRYFPLFSRWQTKKAITKFNELHPDYYTELYGVLDHAGALLKWLLEHEISEDFNPAARAPDSTYKAEMVALSASDEDEAFAEAIAESDRRDFCDTILDSSLLDDALEERNCEAPQSRARKRFLSEAGFTPFPKKIKHKGKSRHLWSRTPDIFRSAVGEQDNAAIIKWLDEGILPDDDPERL